MKARSDRLAELAGSLATVAIATLGGPGAALAASLKELVRHGQAWYANDAPVREAHRRVTAAITAWANGEHFDPDDVERGLALAAQSFQTAQLSVGTVATLEFDPEQVARQVLKVARAGDAWWGREDHYLVAEATVRAICAELVPRLRTDPNVLLPAIEVLRARIEQHATQLAESGRFSREGLDSLAAALIEAASTGEVMGYLRTRIEDWDVSVWSSSAPRSSALERKLRVRPRTERQPGNVREFTATQALADQRMLVVLGGPGSGKTWLARRYARESAQTALTRLQAGAQLDEVELPVLTTWDQWTRTPGDLRESLISASFMAGYGNSDLGGGDTVARLRRTLQEPDRRVLLVVDSLDEAAENSNRRQDARLRELSSLQDWRVVVTSRPGAWDAVQWSEGERSNGPRVVELLDFIYPDDVNAFIRSWFVENPRRAQLLVERIGARSDLQLSAVVPLFLTFYCLLAEDHQGQGVKVLPARRRELFQRLVERLLLGAWAGVGPGSDAQADVEDCQRVLEQWAWHAVRDQATPAGLGAWEDTFEQPVRPRQPVGLTRALDHVAPKQALAGGLKVNRRFVHRTLLEHFLAEYIATLEEEDAAHVLLPHLWFDADWTVAAPAAIIAHNQREQGALLQLLLLRASPPAEDPARQVAADEVDQLLLAVAEESDPGDWALGHQHRINTCRENWAVLAPDRVARSAHWTDSNARARERVLAAVGSANSFTVDKLLAALPALVATDAERAEARAGVLAALAIPAQKWCFAELVGGYWRCSRPRPSKLRHAKPCWLNWALTLTRGWSPSWPEDCWRWGRPRASGHGRGQPCWLCWRTLNGLRRANSWPLLHA